MRDKFRQGEVWIANIIFREGIQVKQRPVVIVANELALDLDVIITPVTSQFPRNRYDVVIEYWESAGLMKPSIARTSKIISIHGSELVKKLGTLQDHDLNNILKSCKELF